MTTLLACIAAALMVSAIFAVLLGACIVRAFVLSTLWDWYIVPSLGWPSIGLPAALGFVLMVACAFPGRREGKQEKDRFITEVLRGFTGPALVLLAGWIGKSYV